MDYESSISDAKYSIAIIENIIIRREQVLGVRGESSIIRY